MTTPHERICRGLAANGLPTDGTLSECIERLFNASKKRKHSAIDTTLRKVIEREIEENVKRHLMQQPARFVRILHTMVSQDITGDQDADASALAKYLCSRSDLT